MLVRAYAQPPWSEEWTLKAAVENLSYVLETPRSIALVAIDDEEVLGVALGFDSGARPAR